MAQQVKFYSIAASDTKPTGGNGIIFVDNGELYKGAKRFGANKVTNQETPPTAAQGAIGGDINIYNNVAKVFDGSEWKTIVDVGGLDLANKASVGTASTTAQHGVSAAVTLNANAQPNLAMTVDAVTTAAGITSTADNFTTGSAIYDYANGLVAGASATDYVAAITRDSTTGKLTAQTKTFPTLNLGSHTEQSNDGGIYVSVTTQSGAVTSVEVSADNLTVSSITAESGTFTNLEVTDTATFSATTVSATTLTVDGVAVSNIALTSASDNDAGIYVAVSTANGGVTNVDVSLTSTALLNALELPTFAGKNVVTAIGPSSGTGAATDTQVPTALAVAKKLATLDNAMHFREVVASTGAISDPAKGDIVVIGATPATGFVAGQEYIYDGTKWELIGDQNTYAANAYSSNATVYAGVENVPGALDAVGAAADIFKAALDAKVTTATDVSTAGKASNLVTAGAVANYVAQEIGELGTAASKNFADTLTVTGTSLPTEAAVAAYVSTVVSGLDSNVSSSENNSIQVGVTQVDGKVTSVTADLVWLNAAGNAID